MSQTFHSLYRKRLCRGVYRDKVRPVLLNSWEAFYFDIHEEACLSLAAQAADLGVELFVVDDGWFVKRNTDRAALGDLERRQRKIPGRDLFSCRKDQRDGNGIWYLV